MSEKIYEVLKKYWGYESFRDLQESIILNILNKKDTLAILPTSAGKSICFQIPGLIQEGICIVISPLISLMQDQVDILNSKGIKAQFLHSNLSFESINEIYFLCEKNLLKFLYISPERFISENFLKRALNFNINLFAIDEAHCISLWGEDFRSSYAKLKKTFEYFPKVTKSAFTASATKKVKEDIIEKIGLKNYNLFQKSFLRKNISCAIVKTENKFSRLLVCLNKIQGSTIIYVSNRDLTKKISEDLNLKNFSSTYYHAGMSKEERENNQKLWLKDDFRIMVATNAFGMGVDKKNVRLVVHLDLPSCIEDFYQEIGRAGRDEKESFSVLFYDQSDIKKNKELIRESFLDYDFIKNFYKKLKMNFQLGNGVSNENKYIFSVEEFSKKNNISTKECYKIFDFLEKNEILKLNENFFQKSVAKINLSLQDFRNFKNSSGENLKNFIETILRIYGGKILNSFCEINEEKISIESNNNFDQTLKYLNYMDNLKIISYRGKDHGTISFLKNIYDENYLPISKKNLEDREKFLQKKNESMIYFIENDFRCRFDMILDYFDENLDKNCDKCDFCRKKNKKDIYFLYENYSEKIFKNLKESPKTLEQIVTILDLNEDESLDLLEFMIKNEKIKINFKTLYL